jgi:adhesin transport system outer membrane protein
MAKVGVLSCVRVVNWWHACFLMTGAIYVGHAQAAPRPSAVYGPPAATPGIAAGPDLGVPLPGIPPGLHRAVAAAVFSHPQVRAAEAQVKASGYDIRSAKWSRFPSLSIEAMAITRGSANASQDGTVLNVVVEQPIWAGGRTAALIDRAQAQMLVQRAGLDEVVRDLALRATQAYFDVAQSARRIDLFKDALAQHSDLVETIGRRVDQQISARSDLDLAKARAAQVEQQLALALAQRSAGVNSLIELTGEAAPDLGDVPRYDPALHHPATDQAVAAALACDPRIARLSAQSVVAHAEQRSARAALFPQLVGQVSSNEILGQRVGVALRAQTGNGLSQAAAAQGAAARALASENGISTAQREVREAIRLDFLNNSAARERAGKSSAAAENSRAVIDSYKRQFIAGRRTWLDVMNALQESTNTRLAVLESETTAQLTMARIALRTCSWEPRPRVDATEPHNGRN